jgi:hypothetical protein
MNIKKSNFQAAFIISLLVAILSACVLIFSPIDYSVSDFLSHFPTIIDDTLSSPTWLLISFDLLIVSSIIIFTLLALQNSSLTKNNQPGSFVKDENGRIVGMDIKKNATDLELGEWGYKNHNKIQSMLINQVEDSRNRNLKSGEDLINQINNSIESLGPEYGKSNLIKFPGSEKKKD